MLEGGTYKNVINLDEYTLSVESKKGWTNKEARSVLHIVAIAHLLFPKNIPTPIRVYLNSSGYWSLQIEKISHGPIHTQIMKLLNQSDSFSSLVEANKLMEEIKNSEEYKILSENLDKAGFFCFQRFEPQNYIDHESGYLIFTDFEPAISFTDTESAKSNPARRFNFSIDKLMRFINEREDFHTESSVKNLNIKNEIFKHLKALYDLLPEQDKVYWGEVYQKYGLL